MRHEMFSLSFGRCCCRGCNDCCSRCMPLKSVLHAACYMFRPKPNPKPTANRVRASVFKFKFQFVLACALRLSEGSH